jgi:hypothetical protein
MSARLYDTNLTDAAWAWVAPVRRQRVRVGDLHSRAAYARSFETIRLSGGLSTQQSLPLLRAVGLERIYAYVWLP